jgi:predicted metalloprotease with PDZ domain
MKALFSALVLICSLSVFSQQTPLMIYDIDVLQNMDTFYITLNLEQSISKESRVFQFAATAPGTYQTMNIGRFVSDFKAYDSRGRDLDVSYESVNQFVIDKPQKVSKITYKVAETFDTRVSEFPIYLMCGSSIEKDHALINAHTMLGYFEGYQDSEFRIKIRGQESWQTGTALDNENGYYVAANFDEAVDSPILTGNLTFADTTIANTKIEIFTYSEQNKVSSEQLLEEMYDMLDAANEFLVKLPVDRYTFLYFFEQNPYGTTGAWEHSYSSEYVMKEQNPTDKFLEKVTDIASHEFFHIVTPLNIHSEVIEQFNYVKPTPSVHLWLYEGVTEWASNMLLFRGGVVEEEDYIRNAVSMKIFIAEKYYENWSLKRLSDESFNGGDGARQYSNIYQKGSLVAGLLDIRLLELSDGTYGLRELILELIDKYGKGKPVIEATFIQDIVDMTYPEITDFFNRFVFSNETLPHKEYLSKIGFDYLQKSNGRVEINKLAEMTDSQKRLYNAWKKNLKVD